MTECSQPGDPRDLLSYKAVLTDGVYLVIPGLLAPEAMHSEPVQAASIGQFLSWSEENSDNTADLESLITRWFNPEAAVSRVVDITSQRSAAAKLGYQKEIESTGLAGEVFRVDPVYQQMDINHATLADQSLINLGEDESAELVATLNNQFASDGLTFASDHPMRWYCKFDKTMAVNTVSLSAAVGRDVSLCRPVGEDSRRWRSLLAEIEMILFSHPVNQRREANGLLPVNSVWLWGEGALPEKQGRAGAIYSGNFYTQSYASHIGMPVHPVVDFAITDLPVLLVDDRLAVAAATGDTELRRHAIDELNRTVFTAIARSHGVLTKGAPVALWSGGRSHWLYPERVTMGNWLGSQYKPRSFESFIDIRPIDAPDLQE